MQEGAEAGQFRHHVGPLRQQRHAGTPGLEAGRRQILQHAGVLQDEADAGTGIGKLGRTGHLRREHLQIEGPAIFAQSRDVAPERGITRQIRARCETVLRIVVPVQLHPDAAHQGECRQLLQLGPHIFSGEIRIGDDGVRPAGFPRGVGDIADLIEETLLRPVRLHVDRPRDAGGGDVSQIFRDGVVATDRLVGSKDPRQHRTEQPG